MGTTSPPRWLQCLLLAVLYFGAARLAFSLGAVHEGASAVYVSTALALAALLRLGMGVLPGVALGALCFELSVNPAAPLAALGFAAIDLFTPWVGAWLVMRFAPRAPRLAHTQDILALVLLTALLAPALSATLGLPLLVAFGGTSWPNAFSLWPVLALSDAVSIIVLTPALLSWLAPWPNHWSTRRSLELLALLTGIALICRVVFGGFFLPESQQFSLAHLVIPFLVLAAVRFEQRGATSANLVFWGGVVWGTLRGVAPSAGLAPSEAVLLSQSLVAIVAATMLLLATIVSERRQALASLSHSETRLRAIVDNATDGIFIKDLEGRYVFINAARAAQLDQPVSALLGHRDEELFEPESAERIHQSGRIVLDTGQASYREDTVRSLDGTERTLLTNLFPYRSAQGQLLGLIGISRDITARKRAEADLASAYSRLKELDLLKSNLINAVSHELRTPLTSIQGFAEFLEDRLAGDLTTEQEHFVQQIQQGSRRLTHLVDDLLDVARLESGSFRLALEDANLSQVVRESVMSFRPQAKEAGIALTAEGIETPQTIRMDPKRVGQILLNLIGNAIKFTRPGGRITVSVTRNAREVHIQVHDTGIGIPPEDLPHVFDKFYQVDNSLTRRRGGTGLGLAITKALVEAHGGTIGVLSEWHQGSTFWFTLPLGAATTSPKEDGARMRLDVS
ncbi:MASE1 domain-containing protein [bacterium]|nr:MASE1 domain-containing protein [bacterium]